VPSNLARPLLAGRAPANTCPCGSCGLERPGSAWDPSWVTARHLMILKRADGRLFRSDNGNPLMPSTWWQVWQKVRAKSLTPAQQASPLMKRPYDLRHSGVTWRLNSGVPATEVAAWAGHSVEVLTRVYARCVVVLENVWIGRMDETLHLGEDR
jgi:integrase